MYARLTFLFVIIFLLCGCATTENISEGTRSSAISDSGFALNVKNLWLGQSVKEKKEIFNNNESEIFYYLIFNNLSNINLFQSKIYKIEWFDPDGKLYFTDKVSNAYGNNNLVTSKLKIDGYISAEKLGLWKIKFYRSGVLLDEKSFVLESPGSREKRLAQLQKIEQEKQAGKITETFDQQKGVVYELNSPQKITSIVKNNNNYIALIIIINKDDKTISTGSGFLVGPNGLVATNYHVVEHAKGGVVKFPDKTYIIKAIEAFDKNKDIALLKIDCLNIKFVDLGNSDMLQTGEGVVAIGSPLALANSVSEGIVSAIRKQIGTDNSIIQITAPIFHGSSGGPLFNLYGKVIGITTAGIERAQNLNFAVPINYLKILMNSRNPVSLHMDETLIKRFEGYRELKQDIPKI